MADTRPGGQKSISASLDFMVQMQGISGAIAEFAGLSKKANLFNRSMTDFGDNSKISSNNIIEGLKGQSAILSKVQSMRYLLSQADAKEIEALKIKEQHGTLKKDEEESLKRLEDKLELRGQEVSEMMRMSEETKKFNQVMDGVKTSGNAAFGALSGAIGGVTDKEAEVMDGLNILKDSFGSTIDNIKMLWEFGSDDSGGVEKIQEAISGASKDLEIETIKVKTLQFGQAVGPEIAKAGSIKKDIKKLGPSADGSGGVGKVKNIKAAVSRLKELKKAQKGTGAETAKVAESLKGAGKASKATSFANSKLSSSFAKLGGKIKHIATLAKGAASALIAMGPPGLLVAGAVAVVAGAIFALVAAVGFLKKGFSLAIKNMEMFRLVNYRALGSIRELTTATYDISTATGLSNRQSYEAIKALSGVGITAKELNKTFGDTGQGLRDLAIMQGKFRRMTDASTASIAVLQKTMIVVGVKGESFQRTFDRTSMVMRKFGISGQEASKLMGIMNESLRAATTIYKGKELDSYVDTLTDLAGAAKRAGASMSVVAEIDLSLRTLKGGAANLMALGGHFDKLIQKGALAGNMTNLLDGYNKMKRIADSMAPGLREQFWIGQSISTEARNTYEAEKERRAGMVKGFKLQGMGLAAAIAAMKKKITLESDADKLRKEAMADYHKSTGTLTQSMQDMFTPLQGKAAKAMQPLVEGLSAFVKRFGPIITEVLGAAIDMVVDFGGALYSAFGWALPILEVLGSAIGFILAIVFKAGSIVFKLFSALLFPLYALGQVLAWLATPLIGLFKLFYDGIAWMADATGFLVDAFAPVIGVIAMFASGVFGAFSIVGGLVVSIIGTIGSAIAFVGGAIGSAISLAGGIAAVIGGVISTIASGIAFVMTPIGWVVAAIFALYGAFLVVKNFIFGSSFLHIAEGIGFLMPFFDLLSGAIGLLLIPLKMVGAVFSWLWDLAGAILGGLVSVVGATIGAAIDLMLFPFKLLRGAIMWVVDAVSSLFGSSDGATEMLGPIDMLVAAFDYLMSPIEMIGDAFNLLFGIGSAVFGGLVSIVTAPFKAMGAAASAVIGVVAAPFNAIGGAISGAWNWLTGGDDEKEKVVKDVDKMGGGVLDAYKSVMSSLPGSIGTIGGTVANVAGDVWGLLTGNEEESAQAMKNINKMGNVVLESYKSVMSSLPGPLGTIGGAVADVAGDVWGLLTGNEEESAQAMKNINKMGNVVLESYKSVMSSLPGPLGTIGGSVVDVAGDVWGLLTGNEEESAQAMKNINEMGNVVLESYKSVMSSLPGPLGTIGGAVADVVGDVWNSLTGGGEEEKESIKDVDKMGGGVLDAYKSVMSSLPGPLGTIGGAVADTVADVWSKLAGGGEEESAQVMKNISKMGSGVLEGYRSVMSSLPGPLGAIGGKVADTVANVLGWLTGGGEEKKTTKSIQDMGMSMEEAYTALGIANSSVLSGVGDMMSGAWAWLNEGGEEEKATKSIQDTSSSMEEAYTALGAANSSVLSGVGDLMSSAFGWLFGGDDTAKTDAIKNQIANSETSGSSSGVSAPVYTSKFDDDTKRTDRERSGELVMLQQETVALLAQILDKSDDPNNKRAAEAMEKIADNTNESSSPEIHRSRKGFGEHVTQWWISK